MFEKLSNIKFNDYPSSGSRDVRCGERDRLRDIKTLTVALRILAKAPNNIHWLLQSDSRFTTRTCSLSPRNHKISKWVHLSDVLRVLGVSYSDILKNTTYYLRGSLCDRMHQNNALETVWK